MSKEAVLKARGEQYDAALRLARAASAISRASAQIAALRSDYDHAARALEVADKAARRIEAEAINDEVSGARLPTLEELVGGPLGELPR